MKKIALPLLLFITVHLMQACTPRPEDLPPSDGADSSGATLPPPAGAPELDPKSQTDPSRVNYILPMDTIHVRDSAEFKLIQVGGRLGDGCQKFEYIDSIKESSTLELTFWASRPKDPNTICTQQMQYLQRELRVPRSAYTDINVVQPGGKPPMKRVL